MITRRLKSFMDWFEISARRQHELEILAQEAARLAEGMTHLYDYLALGALLESTQPEKIFEIGTYRGVTSDFCLQVLPDCEVISIAYVNSTKRFFQKKFNNSELRDEEIGCFIHTKHKNRFTQVIGNSHDITPSSFIDDYGRVDLVFIDGDHSVKGVMQDTKLALGILNDPGTIAWHDANPKQQYEPVRRYLETSIKQPMIATDDNYIGGIACWNPSIENKLTSLSHA